jgi:hypothetical protein
MHSTLIKICKQSKTITTYIILDIVEFRNDYDNVNTNNEHFGKVMNYTNTTLGMNYWLESIRGLLYYCVK